MSLKARDCSVWMMPGKASEVVRRCACCTLKTATRVQVRAAGAPVRFMLMAGAPFKEPIFPYGPFVMNTEDEIQQALADLRNGTFVQD